MSKLDPKEHTFKEIFSQDKAYNVPSYQRNYSWLEENWLELWEDMLAISENGTVEEHYMGPVVLKTSKDLGKNVQIIDGQQRFSTITLFILAAIELLKEKAINKDDEELMEELKQKYIGKKARLSPERKLFLNKYDDYFLEVKLIGNEAVLNSELTNKPSWKLMNDAFKFFKNKLKEKFKCSSCIEIAEYVDDIILENLTFIVIYVGDDINAYSVFETLNARGLELSSTDLLKNYLFSIVQSSPADLEYIEKRWDKIVEIVGFKNLQSFIRYFWVSRNKMLTNKHLFREIKTNIDNAEKVKSFFQSLEISAEIFYALEDVDHEIWNKYPECKNNIFELKILDNKVFKILAMSVYEKMQTKIINVLKMCNIIAFRNYIVGKNPNEFEKLYSDIAIKIQKNEITQIKEIYEKIKDAYVSDDDFQEAFKRKEINTKSSSKTKVKQILLKFESDSADKLCANSPKLSIEHILPEKPTEEWNKIFDNQAENYIYRIGNYTLLDSKQNKDCSRKSFDEKKQVYNNSPYEITKYIADNLNKWDIEELEKRQNYLAKKAKDIWRIDFTS